jgi:hypothetical protein
LFPWQNTHAEVSLAAELVPNPVQNKSKKKGKKRKKKKGKRKRKKEKKVYPEIFGFFPKPSRLRPLKMMLYPYCPVYNLSLFFFLLKREHKVKLSNAKKREKRPKGEKARRYKKKKVGQHPLSSV